MFAKSVWAVSASYLVLAGGYALAQTTDTTAAQNAEVGEIVVTAQKRSESINDVPMSVQAFGSDTLDNLGVDGVEGLVKLVPSFSVSTNFQGTQFYTMRGVGYADSYLGGSPAVTVYNDEVPLTFPAMTRLAGLDVERVEILKGPQGTIFGSNATGGAINYIAARPSDELEAGISGSVGNFEFREIEGYIGGPISSTLGARLALRVTDSGPWQEDYVNAGQELGSRDQISGRLSLVWAPSENVTNTLTLSGWRDKSDAPVPQLRALTQLNLAGCNTGTGNGCIPDYLSALPLPGDDNRAATWNPGTTPQLNDEFYQVANRLDWEASPDVTFTSITSYAYLHTDQYLDNDGTPFRNNDGTSTGSIKSWFQEFRLTGDAGPVQYIFGVNYQRDRVQDQYDDIWLFDSSVRNNVSPLLPFIDYDSFGSSTTENSAVFGNIDYALTDQITLHAGARYTDYKLDFEGCSADAGDGNQAGVWNVIVQSITGINPNIQPGGCTTLDPNFVPSLQVRSLNEDNVSWRVGIDYNVTPDILTYFNVSRGFKSGSLSNIPGSSYIEFIPARQESLVAYELGTKATLADGSLQLNAAVFYYDYQDKQLRARILDPVGIFGALEALVNVPDSELTGMEFQATWRPIEPLTLNFGGTWLQTEVKSDFPNYDPYAQPINFQGMEFPYTPEWSLVFDGEYRDSISTGLDAFFGVTATYRGDVTTAFHDPAVLETLVGDPLGAPGVTLPGDLLTIPSYTLVDLRAGIADVNDRWRVGLFVRNATDEYYETNIQHALDTTVAPIGMPRTYGVTFSYDIW